jgi:hypothetical protein
MAFKASRSKSGLFEIHGIESYLEKKIGELRKALGLGGARTAERKTTRSTRAPKKAAKAPAVKVATDPFAQLVKAFDGHAKKAALVKLGKQKDQLLRALIPLYVAKGQLEVTSGTTTRFWAKHGVSFAAPNVAKALREHVGYARRGKSGPQITPNGIKYVENALSAQKKAA